jgi:protein-tyrosine phosphatase
MDPVVVHVSVDGDGGGDLLVRWELDGAGPVEVAVGPTPETIDHTTPVAVVEGSEVVLQGLGRGRHYVSVAPAGGGSAVVAAERLVALEGTLNFRDLGGYRTSGGGRTRWGRVFRSDALHALTVEDVALVGQLGLRVVYDLRHDVERSRNPSVLPPAVRAEVLSIGGSAGETKEITERILDGELDGIDDAFMAGVYERMALQDAPVFGRLLTGLTDLDGLPALFHCTAGKDRTGLTAALLLSVLGVDEQQILDDYELTGRYWTETRIARLRPKFEQAGIDISRFQSLFGVPREAMAGTLRALHERHGTVDRYLVDAGEVEPEVLDELRARLVQPA